MPTTAGHLVRLARAHAGLPDPATRRRIREAGGLSQANLAEALGVTTAALSRWESGSRTPRRDHLVAYQRLLGRLERAVEPKEEAAAATAASSPAQSQEGDSHGIHPQ